MTNFPECLTENDIDYRVNVMIEKFHTQAAFDQKLPDEILNLPGNVLTNKGINLIRCHILPSLFELNFSKSCIAWLQIAHDE